MGANEYRRSYVVARPVRLSSPGAVQCKVTEAAEAREAHNASPRTATAAFRMWRNSPPHMRLPFRPEMAQFAAVHDEKFRWRDWVRTHRPLGGSMSP